MNITATCGLSTIAGSDIKYLNYEVMRSYFSLLGLLLFACTEPGKNNVVVEIDGLNSDSAVIGFAPQSSTKTEIYDTVFFQNGKLQYNYEVDELYEGIIIPFDLIHEFENGEKYPLPGSRIHFYINKDQKVSVTAEIKDGIIDYMATGNPLSVQHSHSRKYKLDLFKERLTFEKVYNSKSESERTEKDENLYWENRKLNNQKYSQQNINFIKNNPSAEISPRLLLEEKNKELVSLLFEELNFDAKQSYFGKIVNDMINGWVITSAGIKFPNISDTTIYGEPYELISYRGKFVLIDFWGSWCRPCIAEIPELKKLANDHDKDLVITGIACNDNKESLLRLVEKHQIHWPQILSADEGDRKYGQIYGLRNYPTKILLDREGLILKTFQGLDKSLYTFIDSVMIN